MNAARVRPRAVSFGPFEDHATARARSLDETIRGLRRVMVVREARGWFVRGVSYLPPTREETEGSR